MKRFILTLVVLSITFSIFTYAIEKDDKIYAPYFFVQCHDSRVDCFPLLETKAKVDIAGIIANVELVQVYKNEGKKTIEAVYIFPLGVKSAIHSMKMKIGERVIQAKIEEIDTARTIYQTAKTDGKIASLLEQKRPNVFQMKVANIMPNDVVEVTVNYTELLIPKDGVYEFVFPTVVGPRYNSSCSEEWLENPYLKEGQSPTYNFDINVNLKTAIPISKIFVPSHKVDIKYQSKDKAQIKLAEEEKKSGNKDFILRYVLKGEAIQSGLLLYPDAEENFFLLITQPPKRVDIENIPPREYIFIVDVSGSMYGFPLEISKTLIKKIIRNLRSNDYLNILFFSGGSEVLSTYSLPATEENKNKAIAMLESQTGSGSTEILPALQRVFSLEKKEGLSRILIIATDGYVSVEKEVFELIKNNLDKTNVFAFGIGTAVNRYLIEGIARVGKGEPFIVTSQIEAQKAAEKFFNYTSSPILTDITVEFYGFNAYDVEPPLLPDLFAERPLILFGKYKDAKGEILLKGKTTNGDYLERIKVDTSLQDRSCSALKYLWAREKVASLADYAKFGEDVKDKLIKLGLTYSIITDYTAFVAVDTVVRETGEVVVVKQPLPLPEGVSNFAIGNNQYSTLYEYTTERISKLETNYRPNNYSQKITKKVYLANAKFPIGIKLEELENKLKNLEKELIEFFKKFSIEILTVEINIKNGKVMSINIKNTDKKELDKQQLENIFKNFSFSSRVTGILELKLHYS